MKLSKERYLEEAIKTLKKEGIEYVSLNEGYHFKIGKINFYPTTGLWRSDTIGGDKGRGLDSLVRHIKFRINPTEEGTIKRLSVEQLLKIALKHKDKCLAEKIEAIHKEIYG